jgi:hypothetical protein
MPTPDRNRLQDDDPPFHFTNVPAELRERIISELKTRPEFKQTWDAKAHGAGVTLSLAMPDPVEFTYDGCRFTAFAWMGEIHVLGEKAETGGRLNAPENLRD